MTRPLRVLIVEDRETDAELLVRELKRGGFVPETRRVDTADAMRAALAQTWDIVISDWAMPRFSAMAAFSILRQNGYDLPFIIVSGTVGEETAVAAMKIGVHDFMSKDHLSRLTPAIERELREAEIRFQSRQMREQLVISERMASVGTLAAGIAHEINNPLATLTGNAVSALEALDRIGRQPGGEDPADAHEALRQSLGLIREAAERMRLVVRDLRTFSHPGEERADQPVDVTTVLDSAIRMATPEIRQRAQLVCDYASVDPVAGGASRLGQIFLNLIVNAAQAIPEGAVTANRISVSVRPTGAGSVAVEISDTGCGIPPEVLPRIFDPYFTTKPPGQGTGLGLAICHRLIGAIGGSIAVESAPGAGSVFRVTLPHARPAAPAVPLVAAPADAAPPVRSARILVVDDEADLRRTFSRMLERDHHVNAVGSAREAEALIAGGARFDIILCDLMMPEVTGMDLYAELGRLVPEQAARMAFVTGGAFTDRARAFLDQAGIAAIEKPFDAATLRRFVQGLLQDLPAPPLASQARR